MALGSRLVRYFKKEYPQIKASASQIPWIVDDGVLEMLPIIQSDVMLEYGNKVLIIDAKYYAHNMQVQYDALYKKYNIARNERVSIMVDPNIKDSSYFLTFVDGKEIKVEVHRNQDGTTDIKLVGQEEL